MKKKELPGKSLKKIGATVPMGVDNHLLSQRKILRPYLNQHRWIS
jgi:hypothetical protein